jgi:hypothetical protein
MERIEDNILNFQNEPKTLKDFFELLKSIVKDWIEFNDDMYYDIVALWILGTWFHEKFVTYPYLFVNAMKASGKSRLLHLISILARKGYMVGSMTEAVLFRLPALTKVTLCIDEAENISGREKIALRELLNSGYKRGLMVMRCKKVAEQQVIEKFEVFTPVVLANIWGLDDVLEDRCITIPLQRSKNIEVVQKPEFFDYNPAINLYNKSIQSLVQLVQLCSEKHMYTNVAEHTLTTLDTLTTQTTLTTPNNNIFINFNEEDWLKFVENGIFGRSLEIWFPILWLGMNVDYVLYANLLNFIQNLIKEKQSLDLIENRDVIFISFLYNNYEKSEDFIQIRDISKKFVDVEPEADWFNSKWVGRALKRHGITINKRRISRGIEVTLNYEKIEKIAQNLGINKQVIEKKIDKPEKIDDFIE